MKVGIFFDCYKFRQNNPQVLVHANDFNDSTFLQSIPAYSDSVAKYSVVTRRFRSFYDLN